MNMKKGEKTMKECITIRENDSLFFLKIIILLVILFLCFIASFWIGRYPINFNDVFSILVSHITKEKFLIDESLYTVVMQVRFPRIIVAILVGGALGVSGASYQTLFKNPMVSPDLLGVSAGASVGAAIAMLNNQGWISIQIYAFIFGIGAVLLTNMISKIIDSNNITVLILSGIVVSGLFTAILSIIKTMADTENALPNITFWLMGSLAKSSLQDVKYLIILVLTALFITLIFRHQINSLSLGADEAISIGVNVRLTKLIIICSSTIMTVSAVSICGIIGWIGLILPHIARILVGADFGKLSVTSFLCGGIFLLIVDNFVRGFEGSELPLSVITALVGTPIFVILLYKSRRLPN